MLLCVCPEKEEHVQLGVVVAADDASKAEQKPVESSAAEDAGAKTVNETDKGDSLPRSQMIKENKPEGAAESNDVLPFSVPEAETKPEGAAESNDVLPFSVPEAETSAKSQEDADKQSGDIGVAVAQPQEQKDAGTRAAEQKKVVDAGVKTESYLHKLLFPAPSYIFFSLLIELVHFIYICATLDPAYSLNAPDHKYKGDYFVRGVDAAWTMGTNPPYTILNLGAGGVSHSASFLAYEQFYVRLVNSGVMSTLINVLAAYLRQDSIRRAFDATLEAITAQLAKAAGSGKKEIAATPAKSVHELKEDVKKAEKDIVDLKGRIKALQDVKKQLQEHQIDANTAQIDGLVQGMESDMTQKEQDQERATQLLETTEKAEKEKNEKEKAKKKEMEQTLENVKNDGDGALGKFKKTLEMGEYSLMLSQKASFFFMALAFPAFLTHVGPMAVMYIWIVIISLIVLGIAFHIFERTVRGGWLMSDHEMEAELSGRKDDDWQYAQARNFKEKTRGAIGAALFLLARFILTGVGVVWTQTSFMYGVLVYSVPVCIEMSLYWEFSLETF